MALRLSFIINQFKAISTMNHQTLHRGRNFLLKATAESTLQFNLRKHQLGHNIVSQSENIFNSLGSLAGKKSTLI